MTFRPSDAIKVDRERCTGCGACVKVCPSGTLILDKDKAKVIGEGSLHCGHCMAVCPVEAVRVQTIDPSTTRFATFTADREWMPFGGYQVAQLVKLMASRRSCRNYTSRPVLRESLDDLVKIGITAPTGTNSQKWTFTLLPERKDVESFGKHVAGFFDRLNRLAKKSWLRTILRVVGRDELDRYYRDFYDKVREGLQAYENGGRDLLFHGAPSAIVVSSRPGASCGAEDDLLATQNMVLAAHAMGLGTCLIGFAVSAMANDRSVSRAIGIPDTEKVHAVLAIGHPDERYARTVGRFEPVVRTFRA